MTSGENFDFFELPNGLRLVHKQVPSPVSHAGVIIEAGSRHEKKKEHGMAHFIEHGLFKGTEKRKAYHVISRLENVGGDLNAYTAREETFIYASFLTEYYSRTFELFNDILFYSTFPRHEMEKEKLVIIDEINSYKDNPYEMIYDQFDELVFRNHPLGKNILGTKASITSFTLTDIRNFLTRYYTPENMILCSVGNITGKECFSLAKKYFSVGNDLPVGASASLKTKPLPFEPSVYQSFKKHLNKRTYQTHGITGNLAYSYMEEKRQAFALLINLLGGPAMSTRLNMNIREKYGHAYQIEANYSPFQDTGIFTVYMGTEREYFENTMELINKEIKRLYQQKIGTVQLHQAKKQYIGQIAITLESNLNQMLSMGKSYLIYNKIDSFMEMVRKIESVTDVDLLEVAGEVMPVEGLSTLAYLSK